MLNKLLASYVILLFGILSTPMVKSMEEEIEHRPLQDNHVIEEPLDATLASLTGLPTELICEILDKLINKPISENLLENIQALYDKTRNLRLTNQHLNHCVESFVIDTCLNELSKKKMLGFDFIEGLYKELYDTELFNNSNEMKTSNIGLGIIFTSLFGNIYDHIEQYNILKNNFNRKVLALTKKSNEGLRYYTLECDFSYIAVNEASRLIDILTSIKPLIQEDQKNFLLNKEYSTHISDHIALINNEEIIQAILQSKNKDLIQILVNEKPTLFFNNKLIKAIANFQELTSEKLKQLDSLETEEVINLIKLAICLDNHEALSSILLAQATNFQYRNNEPFYKILKFASAFENPDVLMLLVNYCKEYLIMPRGISGDDIFLSPLQCAFDAGNEDNFAILLKYGGNINTINFRQTRENANSDFFRTIINNQQLARGIQNNIIRRRYAHKNITTRHIIKITASESKKKSLLKRISITLGIAAVGFVAYKIFSKSPNHMKIADQFRPMAR